MKRLLVNLLLACLLVMLVAPKGMTADNQDDSEALSQLEFMEIFKNAPPAPNPLPVRTLTEEESSALDHRGTVGYDLLTGEEKITEGMDAASTGRPQQATPYVPDCLFVDDNDSAFR